MTTSASADEPTLPVGSFSAWLSGMRRALAGETDADVPCGECTACCRSSQFVHIGPDEADALAHVPAALLFPAPGRPPGHVLMGYDKHGSCPMLVDDRCSIYAHRPRTCRAYDCRIFPATGLDPAADDKPAIARQASRWRFDLSTDGDRHDQAALRAAVAAVQARPDAPPSQTARAVLAVDLGVSGASRYDRDEFDHPGGTEP